MKSRLLRARRGQSGTLCWSVPMRWARPAGDCQTAPAAEDEPVYLHGAMETMCRGSLAQGVPLGDLPLQACPRPGWRVPS